MTRIVDAIEIFVGVLLLFMALLTSTSAFSRYVLSSPIPDEYELSRLMLGVVVCWGTAAAFRHGDQIQLDLFWDRTNETVKKILTRIGASICLIAVAFFSWALAIKVSDAYHSNLVTVDTALPIWAFYLFAWLGTVPTLIVLAWQVVSPSIDTPRTIGAE